MATMQTPSPPKPAPVRFVTAVCAAAVCLTFSTLADAQFGGGGGGGGHGGRGGRSQGKPSSSNSTQTPSKATPAETPLDEIQIVGVVKAIDPKTERVTIAYEPVEALNWPKGTMPFEVAKMALLKDVTVGEKVRFKLQSQQISELKPF